MNIENELETKFLHKRFTLGELQKMYSGLELCNTDISGANIADYNIMFELHGYDVDLYCLIDRYGKYFITEIGINYQ